MPIYEYECQACGHYLDALQKISEPPLVDCPACNAPGLRKLISAPRFRLKGKGWYETDFKESNRRNLADGDKPASDAGASDKVTKADGKKDAATDKKKSGPKPAAGKSSGSTPA